jgi:hypothetical protein
MRSGCLPVPYEAQDHVRLSFSCTSVQKNLKGSQIGSTWPGSWPEKHSGRARRVGQSPSFQTPRHRQLTLAIACLHTGVSSATFLRSPAARGEWCGSSEPSASRIFSRTFWLVLLHSEYNWQWYRKETCGADPQ